MLLVLRNIMRETVIVLQCSGNNKHQRNLVKCGIAIIQLLDCIRQRFALACFGWRFYLKSPFPLVDHWTPQVYLPNGIYISQTV